MTQIAHDGFDRYTLHREIVQPGRALDLHDKTFKPQACNWCGGLNGHGKLFRYSTLSDGYGARENVIKGLYCSIDCMRACQ